MRESAFLDPLRVELLTTNASREAIELYFKHKVTRLRHGRSRRACSSLQRLALRVLRWFGVPRVEPRWVLLSDFRYYSVHLDAVVTVPAGFDTDFASVPRLPLVYWLNGDCAREPAVVHDFIYRTQDIPRRDGDVVFHEASGVSHPVEPEWRRDGMYYGLRLFGWAAWADNRRNGLWTGRDRVGVDR